MAKYKWESAYSWLEDKAAGWDAAQLLQELLAFAQSAGNDEIQDRYQSEMADEGFFQDIDLHKKLSRHQCLELLEDFDDLSEEALVGVTDDDLRDRVRNLIDNGDLSYGDVANA